MDKIAESASTELITKYGLLGICLIALAFLVNYLLKENARLNTQAIETAKEHTKQIIEINKSHTEHLERITKIFTDRIDEMTATAAQERQNSIAGFHKMAESFSGLQITLERIYTLQQNSSNRNG